MQKRAIAVITAPNMRFVNTGMTTVELAAKSFLARAFPDAEINFFSIVPPNPHSTKRWMMMDLGSPHTSAQGIEDLFNHIPIFSNTANLLEHDLILYWGDFLQARHYIEDECVNRASEIHGLSRDESMEFCYHALLQTNTNPAIGRKTIVFGSSLLYNKASDYITGRYSNAISDFLVRAKSAMFRDPVSAIRANHITKSFRTSYLGIDPAFLLNETDISTLPTSRWQEGLKADSSIGLFFGTRTSAPKNLVPFCRDLADKLEAQLEWLPWFPLHEKLREDTSSSLSNMFRKFNGMRLRDIEALLPRGDAYTQGDLLSALPKYKLVITDTYHLCINAWRAGTPAICIGAEMNNSSQVIKDFKKRILYEMFDAQEFYFDVSDLENAPVSTKTAGRIAALATNQELIAKVIERIKEQTLAISEILLDNAEQVLAPT
ncbi:MAG TPA: polysaccharide pyruvyl transferase family protein [Azoarcus taiwanensis]|nr:polysaccharide pyruvyl transferase family protein [Azoarcus taiwanensis]